MTVKQLVDLYLERQARPRLKARSVVEVERHLLVKAKALHPLGAGAVTRADVARVLARVASSAPVQANRTRASLRRCSPGRWRKAWSPATPCSASASRPTRAQGRECWHRASCGRVAVRGEQRLRERGQADLAHGGPARRGRRDGCGRGGCRWPVDRAGGAQQERPGDRATVTPGGARGAAGVEREKKGSKRARRVGPNPNPGDARVRVRGGRGGRVPRVVTIEDAARRADREGTGGKLGSRRWPPGRCTTCGDRWRPHSGTWRWRCRTWSRRCSGTGTSGSGRRTPSTTDRAIGGRLGGHWRRGRST